jgi:biotin carboxyl carrier protein
MKSLIRVNGKPTDPATAAVFLEVEPGVYSVLLDGCSYEVVVNGPEVEINGVRLQVEREDPRKWNSAASSRKTEGLEVIKSPMPGKVVRLLVAAGDDVVARQGLVVVEAMKMQNELKAPRAGRVASVSVKVNEPVTAGSVLLMIE